MFLVYPESSCELAVFVPRFLEELIGKTSWFHCGEAFNFRFFFFMQIKCSDFVCLLGYI